jgi:phage gp36-like protein
VPYTSLAELIDRYGNSHLISLTDRADMATGVIDTGVIDQALASADALINGYLTGRYKLPLSETPPLIADLAQAIAFQKLHLFDLPPQVKEDKADALKTLENIARGIVRLPIDGVEPAGSGASGVQTTDRERPLEASKMTGFI